jgi:DNA-binding MarR family transcriptional regulator
VLEDGKIVSWTANRSGARIARRPPSTLSRVTGESLSLLFDLFTLNQRTRRALEITMAESPLPPTEYAIYSYILDSGASSPTALASGLGIPVTTLLDHLRDIHGRGHITKRPNPEDGRSYLVELSAAGVSAHARSRSFFDATMQRILDALSIPEPEARRSLRALGAAVDEALTEIEGRN